MDSFGAQVILETSAIVTTQVEAHWTNKPMTTTRLALAAIQRCYCYNPSQLTQPKTPITTSALHLPAPSDLYVAAILKEPPWEDTWGEMIDSHVRLYCILGKNLYRKISQSWSSKKDMAELATCHNESCFDHNQHHCHWCNHDYIHDHLLCMVFFVTGAPPKSI